MSHRHRLLLALLLHALMTPLLVAQMEVLSLADLEKQVRISSPALAPDGQRAVCITAVQDFEHNRYHRQLLLIEIPSGNQRILSTRPGISQPAWSPDGKALAFIAQGEDRRQLFLLPMAGGEATALTTAPNGVRRYAWSPDGKHLAYITDEALSQPTGPARFNRSFAVGSNDFLVTATPARRTVWVTDVTGEHNRQLTAPDVTVGTGLSLSDLSWSSDGKQLTFTVFPTPFSGDSDLGRIARFDLENNTMDWVTEQEMRQSGAAFDPASGRIAYLYPREGVPANVREVYTINPASGTPQSWTSALDRHIRTYRWLSDGSLLLLASDGLQYGLWHSPAPGRFSPVLLGEIKSVSSFDHTDGGALLLVGAGMYQPAELYYKATWDADPVQLTRFNQAIAKRKMGKSEGFTWESTDGLRPDGIITYPPDFDAGRQYPLVLLIHGGPTASSKLAFSARAQLMAAKGWIVFQPNYRGSEHQGNAFQSAIADDAAEGPGEDVISGVRALQEKPYVDQNKIAVSGWSYGGWMTAWLIGRYPEVWTAAVAGAAPVDFTDMYSLNDLNRMRRHAITSSPYVGDNLAKAYAQSPIVHFSKLRTPTLVMSVTGDYRVTVTGSYKLYHALRDNGVPAQFIAYPGSGHFPSDPVQAQDVTKRWLEWLERYLKNNQP